MRGTMSSILLAGLLSLVGTGCGMRPAEMVPKELNVSNHHAGTVAVVANLGDTEGSRVWSATNIASNPQLIGQATEMAVKQYGVFAGVKPKGQSDYLLEIKYTNVEEPAFGLTFDAKLDAHWILTGAGSKQILWEKDITGTGEATVSDALAAVDRARIAEERTVAAHIRKGLEARSQGEF